MRVNTSWPAMLFGMFAIGLMAFMAALRRWGVTRPLSDSWDAIFLHIAQSGLIFGALFGGAHAALAWRGVRSRGAYALAAAAASALTFFLRLGSGEFERMVIEGVAIVTFALPAVVGAMVGYLYWTRAGLTSGGDSPDRLARVLSQGRAFSAAHEAGDVLFGLDGTRAAHFTSDDAAHVDVGSAEYFHGPLQVRTSAGSMLMAAFGATFLNAALGSGLSALQTLSLGERLGHDTMNDPERVMMMLGSHLGLSAATFLGQATLLIVPFAVLIALCHHALRAFDKSSVAAYGLAGLAAPIALGFLTMFAYPMLGFFVALPSAMAMVLYHRLAGLEPKSVMPDIQVADPRALVGADHARRRYGRVVRVK